MKGYFAFSLAALLTILIIYYLLSFPSLTENKLLSFQKINSLEMDISKSIEESAFNGALIGSLIYITASFPEINPTTLNKIATISSILSVELIEIQKGEEFAIFCIDDNLYPFELNKLEQSMVKEKLLMIPLTAKHFSLENCPYSITSKVFLANSDNIEELINNSYVEVSISNPSLSYGTIGISIYERNSNIAKVILLKNRVIRKSLNTTINEEIESNIRENIEEKIALILRNESNQNPNA